MDLWIRSQDRLTLVKCNDISISTDSEDGKTVRGYKIVGYFDKETEYEELGYYTSKERTLEVLDDIQTMLSPKLHSVINKDGINIEVLDKNYDVYEMPLE